MYNETCCVKDYCNNCEAPEHVEEIVENVKEKLKKIIYSDEIPKCNNVFMFKIPCIPHRMEIYTNNKLLLLWVLH